MGKVYLNQKLELTLDTKLSDSGLDLTSASNINIECLLPDGVNTKKFAADNIGDNQKIKGTLELDKIGVWKAYSLIVVNGDEYAGEPYSFTVYKRGH